MKLIIIVLFSKYIFLVLFYNRAHYLKKVCQNVTYSALIHCNTKSVIITFIQWFKKQDVNI